MPPLRRKASLVFRVVVVSLLCLVIAGPLVQLRADQVAVAFLLDRSDSINPAARAEQEQWLAQAMAAKGATDQVAVITLRRGSDCRARVCPTTPDPRGCRPRRAAVGRTSPPRSAPGSRPCRQARPAGWSCSPTVVRTSTRLIQPRRWRPRPSPAAVRAAWRHGGSRSPRAPARRADATARGRALHGHRPARMPRSPRRPSCIC